MCIISGAVAQVAATSIMVYPLGGNRQLTVYANTVALKEKQGAMILPFPEGPCDPQADLQFYPKLFEDLQALIPKMRGGARSLGFKGPVGELKVQQVGSFKASVVPSVGELSQLSSMFNLNAKALAFVRRTYPKGYGFMVCQLDDNKTYHPFGYIHSREADGRLFVPTMHHHDDGSGRSHADWDHSIFVADAELANAGNIRFQNYQDNAKHTLEHGLNTVKWNILKVPCPSKVMAYRIGAYRDNHDLWARMSQKPRAVQCIPKVKGTVLPDYVVTMRSTCDLCKKEGLRFGFHAEPNVDLCMDCHDRFARDQHTDAIQQFVQTFMMTSDFVAFEVAEVLE